MTTRLAHQDPAEVAAFKRAGWWGEKAVGDHVAHWAHERPDGDAFVVDGEAGSDATSARRMS